MARGQYEVASRHVQPVSGERLNGRDDWRAPLMPKIGRSSKKGGDYPIPPAQYNHANGFAGIVLIGTGISNISSRTTGPAMDFGGGIDFRLTRFVEHSLRRPRLRDPLQRGRVLGRASCGPGCGGRVPLLRREVMKIAFPLLAVLGLSPIAWGGRGLASTITKKSARSGRRLQGAWTWTPRPWVPSPYARGTNRRC